MGIRSYIFSKIRNVPKTFQRSFENVAQRIRSKLGVPWLRCPGCSSPDVRQCWRWHCPEQSVKLSHHSDICRRCQAQQLLQNTHRVQPSAKNGAATWRIRTRNLSWQMQQNQVNFICKLSWSISSDLGYNSLFECAWQPKIAKNSLKLLFLISRSLKVIDVGTLGKLVGSACYDKQQVCVYLQPFSC